MKASLVHDDALASNPVREADQDLLSIEQHKSNQVFKAIREECSAATIGKEGNSNNAFSGTAQVVNLVGSFDRPDRSEVAE